MRARLEAATIDDVHNRIREVLRAPIPPEREKPPKPPAIPIGPRLKPIASYTPRWNKRQDNATCQSLRANVDDAA